MTKLMAQESSQDANNPIYDELINAKLLLSYGDRQSHAVVFSRSKSDDVTSQYGGYGKNPIINPAVYDVLFDDGTTKQYADNIMVDNLWSQVDDEGFTHLMLEKITDHCRMDNAVVKGGEYITTKQGN